MAQATTMSNTADELERLMELVKTKRTVIGERTSRKATPRMSIVVLRDEHKIVSGHSIALRSVNSTSDIHGISQVIEKPVSWTEEWVPGMDYGTSQIEKSGFSLLLPPDVPNARTEPHIAWISTPGACSISINTPNAVIGIRDAPPPMFLKPVLLQADAASSLHLPRDLAFTNYLPRSAELETRKISQQARDLAQKSEQNGKSGQFPSLLTSATHRSTHPSDIDSNYANMDIDDISSHMDQDVGPQSEDIEIDDAMDIDRDFDHSLPSETIEIVAPSGYVVEREVPSKPKRGRWNRQPSIRDENGDGVGNYLQLDEEGLSIPESTKKKTRKRGRHRRLDWMEDTPPKRGTGKRKSIGDKDDMSDDDDDLNEEEFRPKKIERVRGKQTIWTTEEEAFLTNLGDVNDSNTNWKEVCDKINAHFGTDKTFQQCSHHYHLLKNPPQKTRWSNKDEALLLELIKTMPVHQVAERLGRHLKSVVHRLQTKHAINVDLASGEVAYRRQHHHHHHHHHHHQHHQHSVDEITASSAPRTINTISDDTPDDTADDADVADTDTNANTNADADATTTFTPIATTSKSKGSKQRRKRSISAQKKVLSNASIHATSDDEDNEKEDSVGEDAARNDVVVVEASEAAELAHTEDSSGEEAAHSTSHSSSRSHPTTTTTTAVPTTETSSFPNDDNPSSPHGTDTTSSRRPKVETSDEDSEFDERSSDDEDWFGKQKRAKKKRRSYGPPSKKRLTNDGSEGEEESSEEEEDD
jgi:hypothetical protein